MALVFFYVFVLFFSPFYIDTGVYASSQDEQTIQKYVKSIDFSKFYSKKHEVKEGGYYGKSDFLTLLSSQEWQKKTIKYQDLIKLPDPKFDPRLSDPAHLIWQEQTQSIKIGGGFCIGSQESKAQKSIISINVSPCTALGIYNSQSNKTGQWHIFSGGGAAPLYEKEIDEREEFNKNMTEFTGQVIGNDDKTKMEVALVSRFISDTQLAVREELAKRNIVIDRFHTLPILMEYDTSKEETIGSRSFFIAPDFLDTEWIIRDYKRINPEKRKEFIDFIESKKELTLKEIDKFFIRNRISLISVALTPEGKWGIYYGYLKY